MPSQFMKINTGGWSQPILNYELEMDGNKIIRPAEDVLHTKFWNPNYSNGQFLYGLSPVEAGSRPVEISNSAFETRKYSYENMGAYGVLHGGAAGSLKQDEAKLLDDSYLEKFGGNKKANRIMIAAAFLQWTQFGMSPVDLDIIKSNGLDKSDIGLLYNIRIELMNNTESTTYDNVLQAKKSLYTETVIPAARDLADELNRWLVKRYNDIQKTNLVLIPSFRDIPVLQDDYEKLHKMVLDDVKNAILSRNEGRKILGRDEVADVPNMNAYTLPRNYIDISNMEGLVDNTEVEVVVEEGKEK